MERGLDLALQLKNVLTTADQSIEFDSAPNGEPQLTMTWVDAASETHTLTITIGAVR